MVRLTGLNIYELERMRSLYYWHFFLSAKRVDSTWQQRMLFVMVMNLAAQGLKKHPKPAPAGEETLTPLDFYAEIERLCARYLGELPDFSEG